MWRSPFAFIVIGLGLAACGKSPAAPSGTSTGTSFDAAAATAVTATVSQALSQSVVIGSALPTPPPSAFTYACPNGGNITMTFSAPSSTPEASTSSRMEFNDCRSQDITMRGDPFLTTSHEFAFSGSDPATSTSATVTSRMTGAIRIVSRAVESRLQYNCTAVAVMQIGATSLPQFTTTGTITWEMPVGTPVRTTDCGPPRP